MLAALSAENGLASPLSSRLLPLVPPGAEIVSGFENHPDPHTHGRLLLSTHNNRLDLDDWQALTGVDTRRVFDEIIEVASAGADGQLTEHLLLVAGRFDRERIFSAAKLNGAGNVDYQGERILLIAPFARERGDMIDTRWLVILDDRTGVLGTPGLVQQALRRYADHSVPDPVLQERMTYLRPDVTSWNVVFASPRSLNNINFRLPHSAWASLQEGADVLLVAAHFGPHIRVDFVVHAQPERDPGFFHRKAAFFTAALGQDAETPPPSDSPELLERRLQNFSVEADRVQGSIDLSHDQFSQWCQQLTLIGAQLRLAPPHGN
jgi:hypothetical protein